MFDVLVDGVDPLVVSASLEQSYAAGVTSAGARHIGRIDHIGLGVFAVAQSSQHGGPGVTQQVVAIGPHEVVGAFGRKSKALVAGGGEIIHVIPWVVGGVAIFAGQAAARFGELQRGVGLCRADGADHGNGINVRLE